MGITAIGIVPVSTFAWFQAAHYGAAAVTTVGDSGITTKNDAEAESMNVKIQVTIGASTAVELTSTGANSETEGMTYVIANGTKELATNQTSLIKNAIGTFAVNKAASYDDDAHVVDTSDNELSSEKVTAFNQHKVYDVKVSASDYVRLGLDVENKTDSLRTTNSWVDGGYAANTQILLGTVEITLTWDGTANKAYVSAASHSADGGNSAGGSATALNFYYSVSPKRTDNTAEANSGFGTISAFLTPHE